MFIVFSFLQLQLNINRNPGFFMLILVVPAPDAPVNDYNAIIIRTGGGFCIKKVYLFFTGVRQK